MKRLGFLACIVLLSSFIIGSATKPTLYIIGDSTVKNGSGKGQDSMWGWGSFLHEYFDTTRIHLENHAIGGRSSRTFITEGRWERILAKLQPGDYVIMQFGHNDNGALNDSTRARGTIKGLGEETQEIDNLLTKKHEIVHTFGWYMRKYVDETKAKGAIPIVCSPVPRNNWKDGKIATSENGHRQWAEAVAKSNGAFYVDLFGIIATKYEAAGEARVKPDYFTPKDNTHTNEAGAKLNAASVVEGLKQLKDCSLNNFLVNSELKK
ncbi:MAG: rhamnogalacturonan acetylesterase [Spirosomataceae bacterium]